MSEHSKVFFEELYVLIYKEEGLLVEFWGEGGQLFSYSEITIKKKLD